MISVSLRKAEDPSRHYYIQVNVPSSDGHITLLWFPVDAAISENAFCNTTAAFGCGDGRAIIFDLTQLNL